MPGGANFCAVYFKLSNFNELQTLPIIFHPTYLNNTFVEGLNESLQLSHIHCHDQLKIFKSPNCKKFRKVKKQVDSMED